MIAFLWLLEIGEANIDDDDQGIDQVHYTSHKMVFSPVNIPFVFDQLLHWLCVILFQLVIIDAEAKEWNIFIQAQDISILLDKMRANLRK